MVEIIQQLLEKNNISCYNMLSNMKNDNTPMKENFTEWPKDVPRKVLVDLFFSFDKSESAKATKFAMIALFKNSAMSMLSTTKLDMVFGVV